MSDEVTQPAMMYSNFLHRLSTNPIFFHPLTGERISRHEFIDFMRSQGIFEADFRSAPANYDTTTGQQTSRGFEGTQRGVMSLPYLHHLMFGNGIPVEEDRDPPEYDLPEFGIALREVLDTAGVEERASVHENRVEMEGPQSVEAQSADARRDLQKPVVDVQVAAVEKVGASRPHRGIERVSAGGQGDLHGTQTDSVPRAELRVIATGATTEAHLNGPKTVSEVGPGTEIENQRLQIDAPLVNSEAKVDYQQQSETTWAAVNASLITATVLLSLAGLGACLWKKLKERGLRNGGLRRPHSIRARGIEIIQERGESPQVYSRWDEDPHEMRSHARDFETAWERE